ncbi:MAG: TetR/AcrR family transcriptional regulator [Actinomycetota bacterium]
MGTAVAELAGPKGLKTPARILDAAFAAIQDFGLTRITVEDVAGRAGLSRQTVYRYFPSKDHLVVALVSREEERLLDGVRAAFVQHDDLAGAVASAVRFCIGLGRSHPLIDRLLGPDQATFLPYVTTRAEPAVVRARETMLELLLARCPGADAELLRTIIDGTTRAVISYILTPSDRSPDQIADTVSAVLIAILDKEAS